MNYYVSYNKSTGKILGIGTVSILADLVVMDNGTIASLSVPTNANYADSHYVSAGSLTPKTISPVYLAGNTLFEIPVNSIVWVNWIPHTVSGTYILQLLDPILYNIMIENTLYLKSVFTIDNRQ